MNRLKMAVRQNGLLRKHVSHWFQTDSSVWSISMKSITYRCHEMKMIRVEFGETRTNGPKKRALLISREHWVALFRNCAGTLRS